MPSAFDAVQLNPQTLNDIPIVVNQYSGSLQSILKVYDASSNIPLEIDAGGSIYCGPSIKLYNAAGGSIVTTLIQDSAQPSGVVATQTFAPYAGRFLLVGDSADPASTNLVAKVNKTNQSADIASTKLTNATAAGMYMVWAVLEDTTADLTAGAVTLSVSWTDDAGATTNSSLTQVLTATGRGQLSLPLYLASGDITFSVGHTGIFGTAKFALRLRAALLG